MKKAKLNKALLIALLMATATTTLAGCSADDESTSTIPSSSMTDSDNSISYKNLTYETAKKKGLKPYKLAYFEQLTNTADQDDAHFTLGFYRDGRLIQYHNLSSSDYDFHEFANANIDVPFVIIKSSSGVNDDIYIYRPPYNQYNQPVVKGKVTQKLGDDK